MTTYHNTLPAWTRPVYEDEIIPDSLINKDAPYKWSNYGERTYDPPAIGTRVMITINNIGWGRVVGYFAEDGWLGVMVKLESPPAWYKKQNGDRLMHAFGAEINPITIGQE